MPSSPILRVLPPLNEDACIWDKRSYATPSFLFVFHSRDNWEEQTLVLHPHQVFDEVLYSPRMGAGREKSQLTGLSSLSPWANRQSSPCEQDPLRKWWHNCVLYLERSIAMDKSLTTFISSSDPLSTVFLFVDEASKISRFDILTIPNFHFFGLFGEIQIHRRHKIPKNIHSSDISPSVFTNEHKGDVPRTNNRISKQKKTRKYGVTF